jgi:hypothetical protein
MTTMTPQPTRTYSPLLGTEFEFTRQAVWRYFYGHMTIEGSEPVPLPVPSAHRLVACTQGMSLNLAQGKLIQSWN